MNSLLLLSTGAIVGIVAAAVVVVLVLAVLIWYISTHNSLVRLKNLVEEGWSATEVQLKKRYDLIPNLVETVKGYATHESSTLEKVIAARGAAMNATGEDRIAKENVLTGALKSLFALQEAYPDLKANTNFLDLQRQLKGVEDSIASARNYYNGTVNAFNTKIELFPASIVAHAMKLEKKPYFRVDGEEERQAPSVRF